MITFTESLIWNFLKNFTIIYPITIPVTIPIAIETGTYTNFITDNSPPFSNPKKEVNNTGEPVLWSPTLDTKKEKSSLIEVTLKAKKNDKVIAESKITIEETKGVYKVIE